MTTNTSGSTITATNGHYLSNGNVSPTYTHISPKSKRTMNSSQSLNKYLYSIPLSSESSSVSTIKLNGIFLNFFLPINKAYNLLGKYGTEPAHTHSVVNNVAGISADADSGRASMASNIDQEQHSPIFQRKYFNSCIHIRAKFVFF
jgi:hypothetical protein